MSEVTHNLSAIEHGNPNTAAELLPLVYDELRRLAAAQAMRRILIDHARARKADKRGGGGRRLELSEADRVIIPDPDTLLTIDETLDTLATEDPAAAELARLRLFAGLSIEEAGESLGLARATAFRDWAYARAFLTAALGGEKNSFSPIFGE